MGRELFAEFNWEFNWEFNCTLDSVWDMYFESAKAYCENHGHLNIPTTYRHEKMLLGKWIYMQRRIGHRLYSQRLSYTEYKDREPLTPDRIKRLEGIGSVWDDVGKTVAWRELHREYEEARV